ncbi:MAG: hypothetical protein K1X71_01725 [Pirellulales bacterium]|nr:hypothetical protein [Pirellulales bacterium]
MTKPQTLLAVVISLLLAPTVAAVDLTTATVVVSPQASARNQKAAALLVEEVDKRTGVRWQIATTWPDGDAPVIALGEIDAAPSFAGPFAEELARLSSRRPEAFRLVSREHHQRPVVIVSGDDERGLLFGVGHLLRALAMQAGKVELNAVADLYSAPRYSLRGHQLGYRPKTNAYDAWDLPVWDQYIRDLAVFGANAIELVPPRTDDDPTSPHFPRPQLEMMAGMSRICDDYGLDVWIWYPALDRDYDNPRTVEAAIEEWGRVFDAVPRIDAIFVPGGDPGRTRPKYLMPLLEKQTARLRVKHPQAQMWVSPQSFNQEWLDEFIAILKNEQPKWLAGVVFGPQVRVGLPELRSLVPQQYPIRHYPDITHSRQCQYPVPDWDVAHAVTSGRECVNPRPVDQAAIFRLLQPHTIGFLTYSEGCNDDVNKFIWSGLGWDDRPPIDILREYSGYFIGHAQRDAFAQLLMALERNWRGPLATNQQVEVTLAQAQDLERAADAKLRGNWRFQQALYRAYYDAYVRRRLLWETDLEAAALDALRSAKPESIEAALGAAQQSLARADQEHVATDLRDRVYALAEDLWQSIRMQTSVEKYGAIDVDRGATLDTLDFPLNNRRWLVEQFAVIRSLGAADQQLAAIRKIVDWKNPGPGGFYDDFGDTAAQPHLVRGLPFAEDPASLLSSHVGFDEGIDEDNAGGGVWRHSWIDHAETLLEQPLQARYENLDPAARYRLRVVYAGDGLRKMIRLVADERFEVHPFVQKPFPVRPIEFDVPAEATADGVLELSWSREPGLGDNGRGSQVSELWLIRQ